MNNPNTNNISPKIVKAIPAKRHSSEFFFAISFDFGSIGFRPYKVYLLRHTCLDFGLNVLDYLIRIMFAV